MFSNTALAQPIGQDPRVGGDLLREGRLSRAAAPVVDGIEGRAGRAARRGGSGREAECRQLFEAEPVTSEPAA